MFFGGLAIGLSCCALSFLVLFHLGKGISIASVLARLIAIALLIAPIVLGRVAEKRFRSAAVLIGTLLPTPLAGIVIVPNAILM
jgi:hypothetical protein